MDFSLTTLFVLQNGDLAPANFKRENLKPTQFGIFNSRYKAVVDAAGANASPYIVFGQGRIENVPGLTHKYSDKVSSRSLIEWYKTTGSPTAKNQITFVGFDGLDNTKTIKAGCDEQVSITVRARSLYIDTAYAYGLTRTVTVTTPCCEDCGDNCETVDARIVAQALAEALNKEPLLKNYIVATPVSECGTPASEPTVVDVVVYHGVKTDAGDPFALATVQNLFPNDDVKLYSHADGVSTYEIVRIDSDPAPADGNGIDWSAFDTAVKVQRSFTLTISTTDDAATLTALQAFYPDDTVTQVESNDTEAKYKLVQTSTSIHETANTANAVYPVVQAYESLEWVPEVVTLDGADCVAGVKIEGKSLDKYGNPCDPIAFPHEFDKLTFEVFAYTGAPTSQDFITFDRCDNIPVTTTQKSTFATGSGDEIFELEKRYHSYQTTMKHIYHLPAYNGAFVRYSDPNAFYDTYVLKFKSPDLTTWSEDSRQDETVIFAVPTGEGEDLEDFLVDYFGTERFTAGVL